jgi:hypothetical protein
MSGAVSNQPEIAWRGRFFEVEQTTQPDGRVFERALRPPGVRLIIHDRAAQKVLLSREYRKELSDLDYRLPGGKVFESLEEFDAIRSGEGNFLPYVEKQAKVEAAQEVGIDVKAVELFKISKLGASMEWDLYVMEVTDWQYHPEGQQLEAGEQIEAPNWYGYEEARQMIMAGHMQEERVALILLQWLGKQ